MAEGHGHPGAAVVRETLKDLQAIPIRLRMLLDTVRLAMPSEQFEAALKEGGGWTMEEYVRGYKSATPLAVPTPSEELRLMDRFAGIPVCNPFFETIRASMLQTWSLAGTPAPLPMPGLSSSLSTILALASTAAGPASVKEEPVEETKAVKEEVEEVQEEGGDDDDSTDGDSSDATDPALEPSTTSGATSPTTLPSQPSPLPGVGASKYSASAAKKRVTCEICKKSYCDKGALKIHTSAVHMKEMQRCTVPGCTKEFTSRRSRNRHSKNKNMKLHTSDPAKLAVYSHVQDSRLLGASMSRPATASSMLGLGLAGDGSMMNGRKRKMTADGALDLSGSPKLFRPSLPTSMASLASPLTAHNPMHMILLQQMLQNAALLSAANSAAVTPAAAPPAPPPPPPPPPLHSALSLIGRSSSS